MQVPVVKMSRCLFDDVYPFYGQVICLANIIIKIVYIFYIKLSILFIMKLSTLFIVKCSFSLSLKKVSALYKTTLFTLPTASSLTLSIVKLFILSIKWPNSLECFRCRGWRPSWTRRRTCRWCPASHAPRGCPPQRPDGTSARGSTSQYGTVRFIWIILMSPWLFRQVWDLCNYTNPMFKSLVL